MTDRERESRAAGVPAAEDEMPGADRHLVEDELNHEKRTVEAVDCQHPERVLHAFENHATSATSQEVMQASGESESVRLRRRLRRRWVLLIVAVAVAAQSWSQ